MGEPMKCEGCGSAAVRRVHTTNGGLALCQQCLDDINRKNPELMRFNKALTKFFSLPNWRKRIGPWKDVNEALHELEKALNGEE
jgi:hypothetical protein